MKYYIKLYGFYYILCFLPKISCLTKKLIYDRILLKKMEVLIWLQLVLRRTFVYQQKNLQSL